MIHDHEDDDVVSSLGCSSPWGFCVVEWRMNKGPTGGSSSVEEAEDEDELEEDETSPITTVATLPNGGIENWEDEEDIESKRQMRVYREIGEEWKKISLLISQTHISLLY